VGGSARARPSRGFRGHDLPAARASARDCGIGRCCSRCARRSSAISRLLWIATAAGILSGGALRRRRSCRAGATRCRRDEGAGAAPRKVDKLDLPANATPRFVGFNVNANALGKATLTGLYNRQK
jgi:hypothetical protein